MRLSSAVLLFYHLLSNNNINWTLDNKMLLVRLKKKKRNFMQLLFISLSQMCYMGHMDHMGHMSHT